MFCFYCVQRQRRPHKNASPMLERLYSGRNICRADVWGEGILVSQKNSPNLKNINELKNVSACLYHHDTCTCLPSQPSPQCRSPSLMGEVTKTLKLWTKTDHQTRKTGEEYHIRHVSAALHNSSSCKNPARVDCTHDAQPSTA